MLLLECALGNEICVIQSALTLQLLADVHFRSLPLISLNRPCSNTPCHYKDVLNAVYQLLEESLPCGLGRGNSNTPLLSKKLIFVENVVTLDHFENLRINKDILLHIVVTGKLLICNLGLHALDIFLYVCLKNRTGF